MSHDPVLFEETKQWLSKVKIDMRAAQAVRKEKKISGMFGTVRLAYD